MTNDSKGAKRRANHEARLTWLRQRPHLLPSLPSAGQDVTDVGRAALELIRDEMVRAGLYSATSEPQATRWGIRVLLSEIRGDGADKASRYKS